jgi:hypothetical protein
MKLATARQAGLVLVLGAALAGCSSSAGTRSDSGADAATGDAAGGSLADVTAPSDGPDGDHRAVAAHEVAVADGPARTDHALPSDSPLSSGDSRIADAPARTDAELVADGPAPNDRAPTPDGQEPSDRPQAAERPALADGPAPPDGLASADGPLPDGQTTPPDIASQPDGAAVTQVTIAVVGDTAQKGRTSHTRAVAALISGHAPHIAGLFIAGDCVRYDGSGTLLDFFKTYWAPASESNLGQFDDIVFPQLGNHEYVEDKAQGYFDYFDARLGAIAALPSYHGSIGTVARGWYSLDMNGWHIVSLNVNCSEIPGGCSAGGAQEQWLSADLAEHAGMPTIAIGHQPRWTCTVDGHDSDSATQPLWARLYDAHADFVFNGHNHFYQRYKPLNKASPAAEDQTAGITEIIVGTGGSSTYEVCAPGEDTRVAKALDGDASLGALFLTTGSDGSYDWEFRLKSDGTVFDSGSGRSHNAP